MKRYLLAGPLLLLVIALGVSLKVAAGQGSVVSGPVYTVAQMRMELTRHPAVWVGRTVNVRGVLQGPFIFCAATRPCPAATLGLVDDGNGIIGSRQYLPVEGGSAEGLWGFFRGIPLLDALIPAPQHLRFGLAAIYHLQLRAKPASFCSRYTFILCYEGVIVDVAPDAP